MTPKPDLSRWTPRTMKGLPAALGEIYTYRDEQYNWHYGFQLTEEHCNAQGFAHGGILMTAIDHGLALVIWEAVDRDFCATVHLDTHFVTPVKPPALLELKTQITKQSGNLVFAVGELWCDDVMAVRSTGVWSVKRAEGLRS
ncbi:MAG: PaaI family thioesterase [Halieaceae bacterium]|nr:PaaI family thioesterase [Halieaceae bacterium]